MKRNKNADNVECKQVAVIWNAFINDIGKQWVKVVLRELCSQMIVRPLDKNLLSKSNQILTHVIDLVNSTYVNWKNGCVMCMDYCCSLKSETHFNIRDISGIFIACCSELLLLTVSSHRLS